MKQYYKKFHLEVIKKAHKIVTRSKIPYIWIIWRYKR